MIPKEPVIGGYNGFIHIGDKPVFSPDREYPFVHGFILKTLQQTYYK